MDFDLTEEQQLLKDSVERLMADRYDFAKRRAYGAEPTGWSKALWSSYAELGLLGLRFAESHGGSEGGPVETMIVMEALGRALALEPYLATVVLAGGLLRHGGSEAQKASLLPAIAKGEQILAFAHGERHARYALAHVTTTAKSERESWVIEGEKSLVLHGDAADTLIVSARVAGAARDESGIALFLVPAESPGLTRRGYPTADGLRAAEISLDKVRVSEDAVLGQPGKSFPLIQRVVDEAMAAVAAEAVGAMSQLNQLTLDYLKTRKQFGTAIGSFQVLQHRAVEMLIEFEQARSMAMFATMMANETDAAERSKAIAAAKVQIGRSAKFIGQQAIQLHGGIGMTMEYSAGHYFKRLTMIDMLFGTADHHLERLAETGGFIEA